MRLWQGISHKDYENRKTVCNWLLRQWLASRSCRSQPSPGVCPFPLSSATIPQCHYHAESTELSPLAAHIRSGNVFISLPLFPTILCYFLGKSAGYGNVGKTELNFFFKTGQPLQWKKWDVISGRSEDKAAGWALGSQEIQPGARLRNFPDFGALPRADNGK